MQLHPCKKNFNKILGSESPNSQLLPSNLTFHNLCDPSITPPGMRELQWNPSPAPLNIEEKITELEKSLSAQLNILSLKHSNSNLCNLTYSQLLTLHSLKNNPSLTKKPTDKNLGPTIMETQQYIQVLLEHLLTDDYMLLSTNTAKQQMEDINTKLKSLINNNKAKLSKAELTFFLRSFTEYHHVPYHGDLWLAQLHLLSDLVF